MATILAGISSV